MAAKFHKLIVVKIVTPIRHENFLDPVEQAVTQLLNVGYTQQVIENILEINVPYVIKELSHKGLLYPDGMFRKTAIREVYRQGYIIAKIGEKRFFDAWLEEYEELHHMDIGEACLTKTELPLHYVLEKFETEHRPVKGKRATKFTEVGMGVCHEYFQGS